MDLATRIYRHSPPWLQTALLNAHAFRIEMHRYGRRHTEAVEWLRQTDAWSADQIRNYQDRRVREIVKTAYESTDYYHEAWGDSGLEPSDIRGVEDLTRLPVLTKDVVRTSGTDLLTNSPQRDWLQGHTSGTTGSPLSLWYDRETCVMTNAVDTRHKLRAGMSQSDWLGVFLGRVIVPLRHDEGPFWRTNWLQRQVWFSSFHMSPRNLDAYVKEIRKRGLRFLEGYPSTLYVLATHVLSSGSRLPMDAVISSSETLHPVQRETVEEAFDCSLFDFYAQAERVVFAGECRAHAGKHVAEEFGYLEIVDEEGNRVEDGKLGYVVGTSLHNTAMPLVRYRTGDVSSIVTSPCECGSAHRRITDVTTKAEDIIVAADGRLISPSVLTHPFKPLDSIEKSQIVQLSAREILVKLVTTDDFIDADEESLRQSLRERIGPGMSISIQVVDDIPRESSGKFRWVISHVETPYNLSWD